MSFYLNEQNKTESASPMSRVIQKTQKTTKHHARNLLQHDKAWFMTLIRMMTKWFGEHKFIKVNPTQLNKEQVHIIPRNSK